MPQLAQTIQNDLSAVGVKAQIKQLAEAPYWTLIERQSAKVPIGLTDWYMDYPDPSDWIGPLFSKSAATTDGSANVSWWWNPQVEALYAQSQPMEPGAARTKLYQQMQQIIMQQAPIVPLDQPILTTMSSKDTGGFYTSAAGRSIFRATGRSDAPGSTSGPRRGGLRPWASTSCADCCGRWSWSSA